MSKGIIIFNLVIYQETRNRTPCVNTAVKIDLSSPGHSAKKMVSVIRDEVTKKIPLFQYGDGDITVLETGNGIDILTCLQDNFSVCGDFLFSMECNRIIVVINPPLVDSESEEENVSRIKKENVSKIKKENIIYTVDSDSDSNSESESESESKSKSKSKSKSDVGKESKKKKRKRSKKEDSSDEPVAKKVVKTENSGDEKKILVRGLPWRADEDQVRAYFAECGEMTTCELPLNQEGRSSGTALMEFTTAKACEACIALNGADYDGRWLEIKYFTDKPIREERKPSERPDGCYTVFVGNLSFDIDEGTLRQAFAECGEIDSIRFAEDRESGEFKGFGHMQFVDSASTDLAVKMTGTEIAGRRVRVDYSTDRRAGGGSGDQGSGRGRGGGRGRGRGGGRGRVGGRGVERGGGRGRGGGGGNGRGRGGDGGSSRGRGGGRGRGDSSAGNNRTGGIAEFKGKKTTFS